MMWQQIDRDNNAVLLRTEVEEYFTAPYSNPPPMMPPTMPSAIPRAYPANPADPNAPVYGDPYSGGYGNGYGYGDGYGNAYPNYEQLKYEARKQAVDFFGQTDANLDQKLSFSAYEDGYAKQMLSSLENSLSNAYPYYYPPMPVGPGYGGPIPVSRR